ncbi:MAG: YciI family protein [Alphaproteobacteria bacterium]|nr:YciI family protein [Alphaproteobacteria bacterium]
MKYMVLIFAEEGGWAAMTPDEQTQAYGAYMAYSEALQKAGKYIAGHELQPSATAKSIAVRNGAPKVVDGPYVDIKEQLGGYYLIEATDEADALHWASQCPGAHHGTVELRPCMENM